MIHQINSSNTEMENKYQYIKAGEAGCLCFSGCLVTKLRTVVSKCFQLLIMFLTIFWIKHSAMNLWFDFFFSTIITNCKQLPFSLKVV